MNIKAYRYIQLLSGIAQTQGKYHAQVLSEQARLGYLLNNQSSLEFRPFLGIINQQVDRAEFTEATATGFELNLAKSRYRSLRSQAGLIVNFPIAFSLQPYAAISWEHEFLDKQGQFKARLLGLGEEYFHIVGTELGRNSGVIKTGVVLITHSNWDLSATYFNRFAIHRREDGGKLQVRVRF